MPKKEHQLSPEKQAHPQGKEEDSRLPSDYYEQQILLDGPAPCEGGEINVVISPLTKYAPNEADGMKLIKAEIYKATGAARTARGRVCTGCVAGNTCAEVIIGVVLRNPGGGRPVIEPLNKHLIPMDARYENPPGTKIDGVQVYFAGGTVRTRCECGQVV